MTLYFVLPSHLSAARPVLISYMNLAETLEMPTIRYHTAITGLDKTFEVRLDFVFGST